MKVIADFTAGEPQHGVCWTNLRKQQVVERLAEVGHSVSRKIVTQLFKLAGLAERKARKSVALQQHPDRDAQFQKIVALKAEYLQNHQVVISVDTKKKELLGNFYRDGTLYTSEPIKVLDHDFPSSSTGKVVPHGIYDVGLNKAHVNLGTSRDTTQFACDSLAVYLEGPCKVDHPEATEVLLLCDGGGSNPSNSWLFKQDLQQLSDRVNLPIRVAHFPPYCSKHNPIEHRLFPHVTRSCSGVIFETLGVVKQLVARTTTRTGLTVTAAVLEGEYQNGRKAAKGKAAGLNFQADEVLPRFNYTLSPREEVAWGG